MSDGLTQGRQPIPGAAVVLIPLLALLVGGCMSNPGTMEIPEPSQSPVGLMTDSCDQERAGAHRCEWHLDWSGHSYFAVLLNRSQPSGYRIQIDEDALWTDTTHHWTSTALFRDWNKTGFLGWHSGRVKSICSNGETYPFACPEQDHRIRDNREIEGGGGADLSLYLFAYLGANGLQATFNLEFDDPVQPIAAEKGPSRLLPMEYQGAGSNESGFDVWNLSIQTTDPALILQDSTAGIRAYFLNVTRPDGESLWFEMTAIGQWRPPPQWQVPLMSAVIVPGGPGNWSITLYGEAQPDGAAMPVVALIERPFFVTEGGVFQPDPVPPIHDGDGGR